MKKLLSLLLVLFILLGITACTKKQEEDIYIVFTNDVHCAIDTNIGYAGVAAYKKELLEEHKYVTLIDVGDFASGSVAGSISTGYYPTVLMNAAGYDIGTFGNHEFDYGMDNLNEYILSNAEFDVVCSNIGYTGKNENKLKDVKPYVIKEYGNTKVAYIGVDTPTTITESTPSVFMEDGEFVYDFTFADTRENFYSNLQKVIDEADKKADYVILLAHFGSNENSAPFRSSDLAENTKGVDVILDGHSHSEILGDTFKNIEDKDVQVWQTGTELINIGTIVLKTDHTIEGMLVSEYDKKDEEVNAAIDDLNKELDESLGQVVAHTDFDLIIGETINDVYFRKVRNRETNLGDLAADVFRNAYEADIGIVNGGGVRETINAGDITVGNCSAVFPFVNKSALLRVNGQTILDMLEYSVHSIESYQNNGETPVGEFGGFLQVSGIKFDVDTSVSSPCIIEEDMLVGFNDSQRRVNNVYVLKDNKYEPLDINASYTIAGSQYILTEMGNGYTMFKDSEIVSKEGAVDTNLLVEYVSDKLNGIIPEEYKEPQGRINVY